MEKDQAPGRRNQGFRLLHQLPRHGYFAIAFTRRHKNQVKATCYAKASQAKLLREKIMSILVGEVTKSSLKDLFKKLLTDTVNKQITKEC